MNFFSLAINNIKKKFGTYLIYLISTTFAVTIFSIFCSIYFNPQFSNYRFGAGKITVLFKAAAIAIVLFSSVFVLYSNKFFVKTRKKEIAIYSLVGMKKSQIGRMMFYENIIMGLIATACGTVLGVAFSRFFSMILLKLMADGTAVTFSIQWEAIATTMVAFLILFMISSLNAYGIIYRYKLIELLSANKESEKLPKYSLTGGILAIVLMIVGYTIAMVMNVNEGGFHLMIPALVILVCIVIGTLLLFKNFIPMAMLALKKNKAFYYKSENIISISQIVYRIKANSKMLSFIAIACAITITMMSATFSMYRTLGDLVPYYSPFSYISKNSDDQQFNQMLEVIDQTGEVKVTATNQFEIIKTQLQSDEYSLETENNPGMTVDGYIMSESSYRSIIKDTKVETGTYNNLRTDFNMDLKDGEGYFIDGNTKKDYCQNLTGSAMNLQFSNETDAYNIVGVSLHKYIGILDLYLKPTLVLSDAAYNRYREQVGADDVVKFTGIMFDNPAGSEKTVAALNKIVPENTRTSSTFGIANLSYIGVYKSVFSLYGAYVFIGLFIGILFLLASGSIMYYKQIIEAQEEVSRYDILKKIGMSRDEIKKSIARQLAIVFGLSLTVGLLHSSFALLTYNRTMDLAGKELPTMINAGIIVGIYIIIYCFFYLLSVNSYMRIAWGREK
ncbi:FtsX-like permease family protein [Acetobacterium fimetarium]|uniref:FtsX-like permease family protein n=1 Tax=Acetobacterium fimetarium TaxID=52691 RepID=A0ABR6WV18_9FIRM|nr:ABC transporter permease [Acetobacterium fimetarium]MBC3804220.1 FtsX-like permease family protein [Acetobacterium fimetarium]